MRLLILFLTTGFMQLSANTYSQTVSLSAIKRPLKDVMEDVRKQTGFGILVPEDLYAACEPVSIMADNMALDDFLAQLLRNQPLAYRLVENNIMLEPLNSIRPVRQPLRKLGGSVGTNLVLAFSEIRGKVVDSIGQPLSGASVRVLNAVGKRTALQTTTDRDGNFMLAGVPEDATIEVTYIGYAKRELPARGGLGVVVLHALPSALDEVVVNKGYYTESRKLTTGSVGVISGETIAQQPVTNMLGALIGRVPGLEITQAGGMPGAGFKVRVRGQNSIAAGNNPLFIIDGVPFASESMGSNQVARHLPFIDGNIAISPFNTLNPADIANVEVLKDADATAIYGSRGANGVILITTKKGQAGKTKLDINVGSAYSKVTHFMEKLGIEEYLAIRKEAYANDGITEYPASDYDLNGTWDLHKNTNWEKDLLGNTAKVFNVQTGISGGSERTQFLVRGGYQRETTVFPGDFHYDRGSMLANINHRSADNRFTLSLSSNYSTDVNDMVGQDITMNVSWLTPNSPDIYNADGSLNWANSTWTNPLSYLEAGYNASTLNSNSNLQMDYLMLPGFKAKVSLGYNDNRLNEAYTDPSTKYNPAFGSTSARSYIYETVGGRQGWIVEPQLTWEKALGKGHLQTLIGSTFQQQSGSRKVQYGRGFSSNALIHDITAASQQSINLSQNSLYKYNALFGRVNYNWDSRYLVNLTARRDGSSRFSPENQFANFGAVGVAWVFYNEAFLQELLPMLSFGKLRGSYGITGNDQIGDYQFLNTVAPIGSSNYQGVVGLLPQRLYNPNFGWETNRKLEAALEIALWEDRLSLSTAWYRNRSSNQLVGLPLSGITGFTSIQANLEAEVQNNGWELELQYTPIRKENLTWKVAANITLPKNKLISFPGLEGSTYANTYVVGQPLSIVKRYHMTGVDPETGVYQYLDVNGDGQLSTTYDRTSLHNLASHYFGSATSTLTWGDWQLDAFFQFVKKTDNNFLYSVSLPGAYLGAIPRVAVENRWQPGKTDATVQRLTAGGNQEAMNAGNRIYQSDAAVDDIYFVRLKNIAISYQLPKTWLKNISGSLFIQGQNLFTLTDFEGNDPENPVLQNLPILKTLNLGFQLTL